MEVVKNSGGGGSSSGGVCGNFVNKTKITLIIFTIFKNSGSNFDLFLFINNNTNKFLFIFISKNKIKIEK